jgi:type II secretory pathway predicted ATPase ExeA
MYEQQFGPNQRQSPTDSTAADVFVGPHSAEAMAGIKKALRFRDAVIAVSGPAGSGKSTLVAKALDVLGDTFRRVWIGRMRLTGIDILEYLLEKLGVEAVPSGPIRQFSALRAAFARHEAEGARIVVVVEDASFCGPETLAELEALTAADAGPASGAAIVLMGDEQLEELLAETQLARLVQRVRQRHATRPLTADEMRGYLRHRFRQECGDFDTSFDKRGAEAIHALSGGNPRIANNILEAVRAMAAATGERPVSVSAVVAAARDELGLEAKLPDTVKLAASVGPNEVSTDQLADLFEDTQPQLPQLRLDPPQAVEPVPVARFDATPETIIEIALDAAIVPDSPEQPEKELVPADLIEPNPEGLPDWDREQTVEELRPDLDALEKAIGLAHAERTQTGSEHDPIPETDGEFGSTSFADIPEITLDESIEQQVAEEFEDDRDSSISDRSRRS